MEIQRYTPDQAETWNRWVAEACNGTFLFNRNFMDYHADRFTDCSLMAFDGSRLCGVLPANVAGDVLWSHQGLTFGGWIISDREGTDIVRTLIAGTRDWLTAEHVATRLIYKAVPKLYHRIPAEADTWALTALGAQLVRRDVGAAVEPARRGPVSSQTTRNLKAARKAGVEARESDDLETYHAMLSQVLVRHHTKPVHSLAELQLLKARFPEAIRLFGAFAGAEMLAGTVVFDNGAVAHTQYLASSPAGREHGALDFLLDWLVVERFAERRYVSFGIATDDGGKTLNAGLMRHKEGLGASAYVHDFYELRLD